MPWKRPDRLRQKLMPMRVLNLGMSRTGTTSLEMLGCSACYHLDYDSDDCAFWISAIEAKFQEKGPPFGKAEWDHIFAEFDGVTDLFRLIHRTDHHQAVSDLPVILFGPELAAAYPEAKILLTVRDPKSWHRSMLQTVCNPVYKTWYHRAPALLRSKDRALCAMSDLCEQVTWKGDCERYGVAFYVQHNEAVRRIGSSAGDETDRPLSERRFLEWQLGEGWDRLAAFLAAEVPAHDYPSGNNVADFVEEADAYTAQMWWDVMVNVTACMAAGLSIATGIFLLRRKL